MTDKPDPPVPVDLDLRSFLFMPLEVSRLRDSDLATRSTGDQFRAAVLLWCAAWHQVPCSSLPSDDLSLANLAGYGRYVRGWKAVKEVALHGFKECSDGRLYHWLIAEKALESNVKKIKRADQTEAARIAAAEARRLRNNGSNTPNNTPSNNDSNSVCDRPADNVSKAVSNNDSNNGSDNVSHRIQGKVREEKGLRKKDAPSGAAELEADLFERGKQILGNDAGGLIVKLLDAKGKNVSLARSAIEMAATKQSPREYIGAIIRGRAKPDNPDNLWDPGL